MKKIPKDLRPALKAKFVSLDRDELDEIIAVLKGVGVGVVRIFSGDYEFDDLDELNSKFGARPPGLTLLLSHKDEKSLFEDRFLLSFEKGLSPRMDSYGFKTEAWMSRIAEIVSSKENSFLRFGYKFGGWIFILYASIAFPVSKFISASSPYFPPFFVFTVIFSILMVYLAYRVVKRPWKINLRYRYQPKFWDRHREKLLWIVVGGLITLAFGLISFWIKSLLFPPPP